jgi:DNA-binding NarL/FixJ family response regulator
MIKILIVDDHTIVREGLKRIIHNHEGILVGGEAESGNEAVQMIKDEKWDVVLMDISMPGKNGLEVLKWIKKNQPDLPVLVLSMHSEDEYAFRAIKAGAAGYLTKQSASKQLVTAIKKVAEGGKFITESFAEKLANNIGSQSEKAPHERLSDREDQVFRLLISGRTVSEIARELSLSVKTISTHRTHILKKMNLKTNAELMHYAVAHGLNNFDNTN